jgi:hypothetical protein
LWVLSSAWPARLQRFSRGTASLSMTLITCARTGAQTACIGPRACNLFACMALHRLGWG